MDAERHVDLKDLNVLQSTMRRLQHLGIGYETGKVDGQSKSEEASALDFDLATGCDKCFATLCMDNKLWSPVMSMVMVSQAY
jgi:hypothetical protein